MLRWLAVTGYGTDEFAWASLGQLVPPEHVKLPSRAPSSALALVSSQPPPAARLLIPSCPLLQELATLHRRSVPRRGAAPSDTESSPSGCSANALHATTTERARAPPQLLPMVTKCSVMIGGQLVSPRWLVGHPGPKSGSAGSSWRPQHTRKSRAARAMTPVLQDCLLYTSPSPRDS